MHAAAMVELCIYNLLHLNKLPSLVICLHSKRIYRLSHVQHTAWLYLQATARLSLGFMGRGSMNYILFQNAL